MNKYIMIFTTFDKKKSAVDFSDKILKLKLVSCVQIIPQIESFYWWKKKIVRANEWLCILKTEKNHYKKVETFIKKNHKNEVPEIVAIPIIRGSNNYLYWISESLKKD